MKKNSLSNTGLSLSQAQSVSNLCNQSAIEIATKFSGINNCSKSVKIGTEDKIILEAHNLPENVVELLTKKAKLHACQAFLMENIKAKTIMLVETKSASADLSNVTFPQRPIYVDPNNNTLVEVNEGWGWEQLKISEVNEYLESEAHAAHIGLFIHRDGTLSQLRNELPKLPVIEWMTIKDGEKSPVTINKHHKSENLLALHNELAGLHRKHEQRVNYFKAKVKNLVTLENARIAKHNADVINFATKTNNDLQVAYETKQKEANGVADGIRAEFEKSRQAKIGVIAALRISVDSRFQETVDEFLKTLPDSQG